MKPGDRVRVVNPRSKLHRREGHVCGIPGIDVPVRLVPVLGVHEARRRFYFKPRDLELLEEARS